MSLFVNLRGGDYGAVCEPYLLQGDPLVEPPLMTSVTSETMPALARGKDVLLATHGFNVPYVAGLRSLSRLELGLAMRPNELFLGVLWPGDWVIPAVNYPFEDKIAMHAGRLLGAWCNRWLSGARSLSFVSHSLGARVVMEACEALKQPAQVLCVTAGAVNAGCLNEEYASAARNTGAVVTLASAKDHVLSLAFPIGDLIADILDDDHRPFERALGRKGPTKPYGPTISPWEIPDDAAFDHGDYLPPSALAQPAPDPAAKWTSAVGFMGRAFRRQAQTWPLQ